MNIMHTNIETIERADNSTEVRNVLNVLKEIVQNLNQRINQKFMPFKIKDIKKKLKILEKVLQNSSKK